MGCIMPDSPPQTNYGNLMDKTLASQIANAPAQYNAEATYEPKYAGLTLDDFNTFLNGNGTAPGLNSLLAGANTSARTASMGDVAALAPGITAALKNANPDNAALLAKLNASANAGLDAGSGLTPDEQRAMQQPRRSG